MDETTAKTKTCKFCGRELTPDHFNKCAKSADGLQNYCRECQAALNKERNARLKAEKQAAKPAPKPVSVVPATREKTLADFDPRDIFLYLESIGYRWGEGAIWRERVVKDFVVPSKRLNG